VFSSSISAALSWPFLVHLAAFDASKPLQVVLDQAARSNASLSERGRVSARLGSGLPGSNEVPTA
jgi:hypothetical protein